MPTSLSSKTYRNTVERVSFSTESTSLMLLPRYLFYDPAPRGARALGDGLGDCLGDMFAPAEPMRGNVGILETGCFAARACRHMPQQRATLDH
jgi:hypothetical protein